MIIVRKVFSKGKKPARPSDSSNDEIDWISHAMKAAKLTSSAAKLIPVAGPFIEGGADVFYMALEPLKQMKVNKEDFKELTQDITTLLETLNTAISTGFPQAEHLEGFTKMCSNFKKLMDRLLKECTQFEAEPRSGVIRNYLRSGDIKGMISKYQREVAALLKNLVLYCTVSTHVQVHKNSRILYDSSQIDRTANEDIPEFEEFMEFKQGHIQLQEEIESHSSYPYYGETLPFKEHHASTLINGNVHQTTVREYKGEAAGELLRADLRILARLKHRDITQVMGFCKSQIFPSIIFYEDLQPIGLKEYELIDMSWDTLEDIFTKHRMRHNIRAGIDHIKATIPSVFDSEEVYKEFKYMAYTPKDTARLGIYLGSDNRPKLSILMSEMLDIFQSPEPLVLTYDQDNILDESILQALRIQFKGCAARKSQSETASLLKQFHTIIPMPPALAPLDLSVDRYHLGGVYAQYCQACQTCQGLQLVANFSLESRDFKSRNWTLPTSTEASNLKHRTTSKGMRLNFTQSQCQKSEALHLRHYSGLKNDRRTQLYESFMAQLCHLSAKLKNERPCFQCKLTSLRLVSGISWHLDVQLGNHTKAAVTWPVDEIFLFVDNPVISENGYIKRPNIYWSRCPKGSTRLATLELHVFGVEVPRLSCRCWGAIFDSNFLNIKPLQEFYELFGLDPFSDDVARAAGALLPRHLNSRNSKQKRRHSFTAHRDIIHDRDEFTDGWRKSYRYSPPKNVRILQESSSHLGIRVPVHWELLAAAEVLPEYLRWYDLRTTGHEFEYGEVNMDPKYDELPSRCRDFMHDYQSRGKSLEEMIRKFWPGQGRLGGQEFGIFATYDYDSDSDSDSGSA
ncbi:hypothetical protein M422DRAFT_268248 [Sphaerobolus stellatus SS14]|uniref:Uncharacterized protein n=1 Tax=Sphaerobolus stellatus (strain SS14) TaxID=990650 RepID=A0A0C9U7D8_SPHS4|nr:hypothetical protein M422DRAFT_268248 [Sphaerobolus stellatus SS14]